MRFVLFSLLLLTAAASDAAEEVSFSSQIAPLIQAKCLSCHSSDKAKGGYRMHTFEALLKAGKSDEPAVFPGNPEGSELFRRITTKDDDDRMPQKDEPLTTAQVELFRSWIASGAKLDRGERTSQLSSFIPRGHHPNSPEKYRRPLPILSLAFTPDGKQLAVSGHHEVTFWNFEGQLQTRLTNVPQRVRSMAFDPNGNLLALAGGQPGRGGELSIYNLSTGQIETNLVQTPDELLTVTFSADGKRLAAAGTDNAIHVFDWEKRQRITTIQQHADWVTCIRFSADGAQIASASRDRTARVYETSSGKLDVTYTSQNAPLYVVAFLPDGNIASGGREKSLHTWSIKEGKKKSEIGGLGGDTYALIATNERLFSAGADGIVRQHTISDRKLIRTFTGHGDAVYALAYHEGSGKLASGSYDGVVNIWNADDGSLQKSFAAAPGWSSNR